MALFVLSCKDGWVNIMYDGLDAVGVDQQVNTRPHYQEIHTCMHKYVNTHTHAHTGLYDYLLVFLNFPFPIILSP